VPYSPTIKGGGYMEITREFLTKRLEGLNRQLHETVQQELMIKGAIQDTQDYLKYLDEKEPENVDKTQVQ